MTTSHNNNLEKYTRFRAGEAASWGLLRDDTVYPIEGDLLGQHTVSGTGLPLEEAKRLAPATPPKILCVGLNFRDHIGGRPEPTKPELFYKPTTSLQDPGGPIILPEGVEEVHHEGELVLVIGKRLRNGDEKEAAAAIWGVTCGNDVSERNWQMGPRRDVQWWRAKGCDTFGPLGPVLVRGLNYNDLLLTTRLNGATVQQARTSEMIFSCTQVVSFVSQHLTLEPGDLVWMGTPGQTQPMRAGDVVEVEIEGVGILRNTVLNSK